jgi:hypothetical protein
MKPDSSIRTVLAPRGRPRVGIPAAGSISLPNLAIPAGLALATFAAAVPWLHAFRVPGQAAILLLAAILPVGLTSISAGVLQRPAGVSYGLSAAGLVVLLAATAGLHMAAAVKAIGQVPDRVVAETLPLTGNPDILAPVIVLTWLCAAASTELAYRSPTRSGVGDIALAVPVAFFVLSYAVSAAAPGRETFAGGMLLVSLVVVALGRHERLVSSVVASAASPGTASAESTGDAAVSPPTRRRVIEASIGGSVVLAVVLTTVVAGTGLLSGHPTTLNKPAPVSSAVINDPVGATASIRDGDPGLRPFPVMRIGSDRPLPGYLAAAVLENFDGSEWNFNATFEPTGERVPSPRGTIPVVGSGSVRASETVISSLPSRLLPAPDRPVSVRGQAVAVDASTGMILPRRAAPGSTFVVVSDVPVTTLAGVPAADGIGSAGESAPGSASPDLALPPDSATALGVAMRFITGLTGTRPTPTVGFLQRVLLALHTQERQLSPYAPSAPGQGTSSPGQPAGSTPPSTAAGSGSERLGGTSLSEVINAVTIDRSATPEQFATFYALVARYIGVPARIATGFRVATGSTGATVSAGTHQVDNRQAWTWVEIPVSGMGWVVADPTPDTRTGIAAPPPEQAQATPTTLPINKANAVPKNAVAGGHAIAKPARFSSRTSSGVPPWLLALIASGGVAAVLLGGPALSAIRRRLRSRARRSEDPTVLATGAWLELLDGLDRAGMRIAGSSTSSEVATEAAAHFGAEVRARVRRVAEVADRGLYSTLHPPSPDDAAGAWFAQRDLTRDILRGLDRRQRARALIAVGSSPRSPEP